MGITLRHGRALMSKELLQGVKGPPGRKSQHGGVKVPDPMQGPEVFGEARPLIDAVHLLSDIYPLSALATRKDKWAFGPWVR